MGVDGVGAPSFGKSVRSLLEALTTLEKEFEIAFDRAGLGSPAGLLGYFRRVVSGVAGGDAAGPGVDLVKLLGLASGVGGLERPGVARGLARALGLAEEASVEAVRGDVREIVEQVARLREREVALAGGVSQLRARAARFDEALAGLARVQGKYVARLDAHAERSRELEQLAGRRDDHITRLIRDTAAQRSELERVARELAGRGDSDAQTDSQSEEMLSQITGRVEAVEVQLREIKKLQKTGTHGVIESLDAMRDRVGKLEARAAEMSREARAKGGRLDALARHVTTVEGRLTSALGKTPERVVPVPTEIDKSMHAPG